MKRICSVADEDREGCGKVFRASSGTSTCPHCDTEQEVPPV